MGIDTISTFGYGCVFNKDEFFGFFKEWLEKEKQKREEYKLNHTENEYEEEYRYDFLSEDPSDYFEFATSENSSTGIDVREEVYIYYNGYGSTENIEVYDYNDFVLTEDDREAFKEELEKYGLLGWESKLGWILRFYYS